MTQDKQAAAKALARRLNTALFAIFAFWLAALVLFWTRTAGPFRPYDAPAFDIAPLPWLLLSIAGALSVRFLPARWFRIGALQQATRTYERVGVKTVRFFITDGDLVNRLVRRRFPGYRVDGGEEPLKARLETGIVGERAHLGFLVLGIGSAACAAAGGWADWAVALTLGNVLVNFYPILLQRYTRARVEGILAKRASTAIP